MSDTGTAKTAKVMPKGGRKGGAIFPRIDLEAAVAYAKRLVSKTHTAPQSLDIIYSGVLGAKGSKGNARISALKQYGFTAGNTENGFSASDHAKQLVAAPPEEVQPHYRAAVLRPKIFKALFDTYHGDAVTHAKLKQRAAALKVHPDETEKCVDIYLKSAQLAGLVIQQGDSFKHLPNSVVSAEPATPEELEIDTNDEQVGSEGEEVNRDEATSTENTNENDRKHVVNEKDSQVSEKGSIPRAIFNVNVTLDSSLDTEKLQRQLELLKKYGAI